MKNCKGLFEQTKEYKIEQKTISEKEMLDFIKDSFKSSKKPKKRWMMLGLTFIKGYRKKEGDTALYELLQSLNIQCGEKTYNYIIDFVKKYKLNNPLKTK